MASISFRKVGLIVGQVLDLEDFPQQDWHEPIPTGPLRIPARAKTQAAHPISLKYGNLAALRSKVSVWEQPDQELSAPIRASSNSPVPRFRA